MNVSRLTPALLCMISMLMASATCRAQVSAQQGGSCLSSLPGIISNVACTGAESSHSAYEEFRSRFFGEIIKQIWKKSKKRHIAKQLRAPELQASMVAKEGMFKKMFREAEYDMHVSSNRFVLSMQVRF